MKKILILSGILIVLVITIGCVTNLDDSLSKKQEAYEIDASCEIQEFNLSIINNQTIVPVNDADIDRFPEFSQYMKNVKAEPITRSSGTRLIKDFNCNASRTIRFLALYRKYEHAPNQPVLEYQDRYYKVGFEYFHSHSTATPTLTIPGSTQTSSLSIPYSGLTADPGSRCNPIVTNSRIPVPENISVAIRDPMPGIRYSIHENASEKTIVLEKGDLVEINLRWTPGLAYYWIVPVSGCGLEVVQAGTYTDGGDFWNNTGHYRIRYRAITSGTSSINGRFGLHPAEESNPDIFNLTVNVK